MQTSLHLQGFSYLGHNLNRDGRVLAPQGHLGAFTFLPSVLSHLRDWLIILPARPFACRGMPLLKVVKCGQPGLHNDTICQSIEFRETSEINKWGDS